MLCRKRVWIPSRCITFAFYTGRTLSGITQTHVEMVTAARKGQIHIRTGRRRHWNGGYMATGRIANRNDWLGVCVLCAGSIDGRPNIDVVPDHLR